MQCIEWIFSRVAPCRGENDSEAIFLEEIFEGDLGEKIFVRDSGMRRNFFEDKFGEWMGEQKIYLFAKLLTVSFDFVRISI